MKTNTNTNTKPAEGTQSADKFYIVKGTDCFGDTWPMSPVAGIMGKSFPSKTAAIAWLESQKATKAGRVEMRLGGGWDQNTLKSLSVHEVIFS